MRVIVVGDLICSTAKPCQACAVPPVTPPSPLLLLVPSAIGLIDRESNLQKRALLH